MTGLLAFDRNRLEALRLGLGTALDDLRGIRSDDIEAAEVVRSLRGAARTISDVHLRRVHDILVSQSMTWYRSSGIDAEALAREQPYSTRHDRSWEVTTDLVSTLPDVPCFHTVDAVLAAVRAGDLVPLDAPLDADGRAGAHYTSIAIAASTQVPIGTLDRTSNVLKLIDFFSDGLNVGWHEHKALEVVFIPDARLMRSVHVLTTVDRVNGPETLTDLTTEAVVSGYLILNTDTSTADVSVGIGPDIQDPTESWAIVSGASSSYSGVFYPVTTPDFEPISREPRFVNPPQWTFTKSAGPVFEGWGTWGD